MQTSKEEEKPEEDNDLEEVYQATWYRWVILVIQAGMVMNAQMVLSGFGPLLDPVVNGFKVNESWVILL